MSNAKHYSIGHHNVKYGMIII